MCWTTHGGEKQPGQMFGRGGKVKLSKGGLLCTPLLCYTPKACATAAIQRGNKDMASSCAMYDLGTNSACSGALRKVACRSPGRLSNGFHGGRRWTLPAGGQKGVSPQERVYRPPSI